MEKYIGALDLGTTSSRFVVVNHRGRIVGVDQMEHEQIFPRPGWVEHVFPVPRSGGCWTIFPKRGLRCKKDQRYSARWNPGLSVG
jgi:hypothetical protein